MILFNTHTHKAISDLDSCYRLLTLKKRIWKTLTSMSWLTDMIFIEADFRVLVRYERGLALSFLLWLVFFPFAPAIWWLFCRRYGNAEAFTHTYTHSWWEQEKRDGDREREVVGDGGMPKERKNKREGGTEEHAAAKHTRGGPWLNPKWPSFGNSALHCVQKPLLHITCSAYSLHGE